MLEFVHDLDEVGVVASSSDVSAAEILDAFGIVLIRPIVTLIKALGEVTFNLCDEILTADAKSQRLTRPRLCQAISVRAFAVGTPATDRLWYDLKARDGCEKLVVRENLLLNFLKVPLEAPIGLSLVRTSAISVDHIDRVEDDQANREKGEYAS